MNDSSDFKKVKMEELWLFQVIPCVHWYSVIQSGLRLVENGYKIQRDHPKEEKVQCKQYSKERKRDKMEEGEI